MFNGVGLVRVLFKTGDDVKVRGAGNYGMRMPNCNNKGNHCLMGWV